MDRNRLWAVGAIALIGATAVLGWVLGIVPKLSEASGADTARVAVETQNSAYETQVAALETKFAGIDKLKADLAALQLAVPTGADIPAFVAQLDAIGQQHQVTLTDISVSDAQVYAPVVADAAAPQVADTSGMSPKPSPLITPANFVSVPISLTVTGGYGNVLDFVEGLQKGNRLVMVTTFSTDAAAPAAAVAPSATGKTAVVVASTPSGAVTGTISGLIYVLLDPATSAATPAG